MAFIPNPTGVEVRIVGEQNGVPVVNVLHVNVGATPTEAICQSVCGVFMSWFSTYMANFLHSSYTLTKLVGKSLASDAAPFYELIPTTGNVGLNGGSPAAANVALVASFGTGLTGRSFRGRMYLGALPQVFIADAQHVTSGITSDWIDALAALIDALDMAGYTLSVFSKFVNGVARTVGILTEIVSIAVNTKVDSQRRRTAN